MKILNIHVYIDDQKINIRFDAIGRIIDKTKSQSSIDSSWPESNMFELFELIQTSLTEENVIASLKTNPNQLDDTPMGGIVLDENEMVKIIRDPLGADYFCPVELKIKMITLCSRFEDLSQSETVKQLFNNSCRRIEVHAFTPQVVSPIYFNMNDNDLNQCEKQEACYQQHSVVYTLSTTPHIALNFILCAANVVTHLLKYDAIYFNPEYEKGLSQSVLQNNMGQSGHNHGNEFMVTLFKRLFELQKLQIYSHTINALVKIGTPYITYRHTPNQKGLMDLMQLDSRCELLWKPIIDLLFNPAQSNQTKVTTLLSLARDSIYTNQAAEFNFMMHSIHLLAKKKLYEPCIGKNAHDGGVYAWTYTEWYFLRDAEFTMRSDGRICIINVQHNPGYTKYYAPQCGNGVKFTAEMQHLGQLIGLEFDECDFNQEIIFTPDCTKRLLEQGVQCSLSYVKSALHIGNRVSFFARQPLREQQTPFRPLLWELIGTILQNEASVDEQFNHLTQDDMREIIASAELNVSDSFNINSVV